MSNTSNKKARIKTAALAIPTEAVHSTVTQSTAKLTAGTLELVQMVLSHAQEHPEDTPSRASQARDFQAAYTSIVQSVPKIRRAQLLRSMREGLDQVFKSELSSVPISTSDFMNRLAVQEAQQRDREISEGELIPAAKLAARLAMTPQGLHHALKAKRIFAMQGGSGERVYPAFYADPKQDRKQLERVSKALGDLPGAAKWDFFMSPRLSLGKRTPLEALAKGKFEAVMVAANTFADA